MKHLIYIFCLCLLWPSIVFSQTPDPSQTLLSPEALFLRCYAHLTGLRPPENHTLLLRVRAGTISPIDACMQVLAKANLIPIAQSSLSADLKRRITPTNPATTYSPYTVNDIVDNEGVVVLNKFHNLHRMFFGVQDLSTIPAFYRLPDRFNDPTEAAVYLTRLLFLSGAQFRESVTGNYAVRGIRSLGAWSRTYYTGGSDIWNLTIPGTGLERGMLWGVGAYAPGNLTWLTDGGQEVTALHPDNLNVTMRSQRSYGGGIMGLSSYVLMNSGFPNIGRTDNPAKADTASTVSNGTFRMHRRWAKAVFNDLLCRPLPALRGNDVSTQVANYLQAFPNPSSQVAFRTSATCMACHGAMDPMAATVRSLFFYQTENTAWLTPQEVTHAASGQTVDPLAAFVTRPSLWSNFSSLQPRENPPNNELSMMARDSRFYERPGSGDLRYRSYDGTLVWQHFTANQELDGLAQLGDALAQSNDLYVCAASRYFKYFTGIEVNLQDIQDPANPTLSADDLYYRNIVIQLGLQLKVHQNLQQLIRQIFELSIYKKVGLRDLTP